MFYRRLRFDIWLCLFISFLLSSIPTKIVQEIYIKKYDSYIKQHEVEENDIGGIASEDILRAQNIEDLLNNEKFTVVTKGIKYMNEGAGYHNNYYMYALTLPSGERIAALINMEAVQKTGESIYDGDSIMPVGKIVYDDLNQDTYFLEQIEHSKKLSRYDFYIDMLGRGGKQNLDDYVEIPIIITRIISIIICFILLHMLGSKMGIFPYFIHPKEKTKNEWD
ncbi:MAG: hypothetical protein HFI86_03305 [Bacilli bacterium]|nr:hypothetical protein [Bacilli bacterium]